MPAQNFAGFPKEAVTFLTDLTENNNKPWFDEHKSEYEEFVLAPARQFIVAMGERLKVWIPEINADPRVNKSLFRIYRDTRFSANKTPYKTNLAIWFWQGTGKSRVENSGFYFSLTKDKLMLGSGSHIFGKEVLPFYRDYVNKAANGDALLKILDAVRKSDLQLQQPHYKRVPRGFDADSKYEELLRLNGVSAFWENSVPAELYSPDIIDFCLNICKTMLPLQQWAAKMLQTARR
ncbi:MAG: DUF2461 domain-containing protein [Calditrichaeota bacterium]|nr:MAG: DUF2461 domain-containing protein [Calditrichota bacterium]